MSYLEPLDGLLTGRAEDAIVEVADGAGAAGQGRQRRGGTHPCHCIGHCGEITPLIDSLAIIDKVLVIAQVCQRERRCMEVRTDGRKVGADAGYLRRDITDERDRQRNGQKKGKNGGTTRRKSSNNGS